jgi:sugar phosphate isomerase/epimerase
VTRGHGQGRSDLRTRLALHTWTLDTTPLAGALRAARAAGWPAVELRRVDFARAAEAGQPAEAVLDLVRASGLAVACVGGQLGWMFSEGAERRRLLDAVAESCRWARALGAPVVMSPADLGTGDLARAAAGVRELGDRAAEQGVRLALEPPSQAAQLNTVERLRELLARAGHPHCGLLVDAYHLHRGGGGLRAVEDLAPGEIAYVQYSDVPRSGLEPGQTANRLPPGQGIVPFREFFALVEAKGYAGHLSYEAPNPAAWARDPEEVAREALAATLAALGPGPGGPGAAGTH